MSSSVHPQHTQQPGHEHPHDEHHDTIGETVHKAMHAEDEPMESSAPFALVALTYLAILAVAALCIAAVAWWL
ncbi:hypothetical protein [Roseimaritima ulvae]|uniref:Uncharacterized protein n=1 Tax=Roseimaritima ulvae TaxID=980254 RepID=A0A5B9R2F3_9BACT|nr:hypothetical protein [Roseimaritima ulvae]QEG40483.1 hypothetical protein UC8_24950 [Roseimaritima ulvae]